ncbi:hypothetical protein ACFL08_04815 [Patescibacteria group bacterium]
MKNKIYLMLSALVLSLTMLVGSVSAQENLITNDSMGVSEDEVVGGMSYEPTFPEDVFPEGQEGVSIIAEVEIFNARVVSQDGSKFKISFDVANGRQVQPQVMYSVQLTQSVESPDGVNRNRIVYEKVYSDTFSLSKNDIIHKDIEFDAPEILNGTFNILVNSQNESGMPFALGDMGEITLTGGAENHVVVDDSSCYVKIEGDEDMYPVQFGVDISSDEKISLICSVTNGFSNKVEFQSSFDTFERTRFGKLVSSDVSGEKYSLEAGETKKIILPVVKAEKPQSYEVALSLVDSSKRVISGETIFRYVVRGNSASVQNLRLDKDYYYKGDVAKASFYVAGSADSFFSARSVNEEVKDIVIETSIVDVKGKVCAETVSKTLKPGREVDLDINITRDCNSPQISVVAKDSNGNILHENKFSVETRKDLKIEDAKIIGGLGDVVKWIGIFFAIVFIIAIVVIAVKKRKGGVIKVLLLTLFAGTLLVVGGDNAKAATFNIESGHCNAQMSVGINKWWYFPSESVKATASSIRFECCNNVHESWASAYFGFDSGGQTLITSGYQHRDGSIDFHATNTSYDGGGSAYKAAPTVPGVHRVNYRFYFTNSYNETGNYYANANFGVKGTPVAHIDLPANNSSVVQGTNIHFKGHGTLGAGGGSINGLGWVDARSGTASWNGTTCTGTDGAVISGSLDFYKSNLSLGTHRICLSVRQRFADGTERWNKAIDTDHITLNIVAAPVNGSCNSTVAKDYPYTATTWSAGAFCTTGTPAPTSPTFPNQGATTTWTCSGANGGTSASCSANRESAPELSCGINDGTYTADETAWPGTAPADFCTNSTPVTMPAFPDAPGSVAWSCTDPVSGVILSCSATRSAPITVNGTCSSDYAKNYPYDATTWSVSLGTPYCSQGSVTNPSSTDISGNPAFPTQGGQTTWLCSGLNGGIDSPPCIADRQDAPPPVCADYTYSCFQLPNSYCDDPANCEKDYNITQKCDVKCDGVTVDGSADASVCRTNGVSCSDTVSATCGACGGDDDGDSVTPEWIEVNP